MAKRFKSVSEENFLKGEVVTLRTRVMFPVIVVLVHISFNRSLCEPLSAVFQRLIRNSISGL